MNNSLFRKAGVHRRPSAGPAPAALRSTDSAAGWLLACSAGLAGAQEVSPAPAAQIDTGLGQQLRQQIASTCYGFVDHDPGLVRGFKVDSAFQLLRDGYPWAQFKGGSNLLIEREEVLVGGAGSACAPTPPGGAVNLITRREAALPARTVAQVGQYGSFSVLQELAPLKGERLNGRLALREERGRNAADERSRVGEAALQLDWALTEGGRLRLDLEWQHDDHPNGTGWPAVAALPLGVDPGRSLEQPWTRYQATQTGLLLAYEQAISPDTELRFGWSHVQYDGRSRDLYLEPLSDPTGTGPFAATAYAFDSQRYRFDALHADFQHRYQALGAEQRVNLAMSQLALGEPDDAYPAQDLGTPALGAPLAAPEPLPPEASRRLASRELRATLRHTAKWPNWQTQLAAVWARFRDDNGSALQEVSTLSPLGSIAWLPDRQWRLQFTRSEGATGRQYASVTSSTPDRIAPPGKSVQYELGLYWRGERWNAGAGVFELTRPYRFERETVSVWRGEQRHRGVEGTLSWNSADDHARVVLTAQALRAQVTSTGDPTLEGKRPPGVPGRRASLYAEAPWPGSVAWSLSLLGETVSRRATFDDNRVLAAGYARWDLGLQWQGKVAALPVTLLVAVQNAANRRAWETVGGGLAYPLAPRKLGLTLTLAEG